MLTKWLSQVVNIMRYGKKNHTWFYQDKMREDDVGKKKSTTPSLAFPFALFLNKTSSFREKIDMCFGGSGIKKK